MSLSSGPNSATLGLTFAYDVGDIINSYIGEPTTNLIPSPEVNAYPTAANGWCSYNTNRYCDPNPPYTCAAFWPIPTIASVTGNIVTTVSAHPIRSFDVLRPQSTGGGLIADTDYLMRKISDTQFSVHTYNSSQNGSQGYNNPLTGGFKVHDSYWLDQRVSVNATSFPTMWWGAPHLPNSGLVKEAITGGFNVYPSRKTDCLRLHYFRTDGVADGMSYCVDATTVSGSIYNVSFWTKSNTPTAVNKGVSFTNYNYGTYPGYGYFGFSFALGPEGVWQRQSYSFTATHTAIISYWFGEAPGSTSPYSFDLANIQVEQKNHPTQFVAGTRSTTSGLLNLAVNNTVYLDNASFNSDAQIALDGSNDYIKAAQTSSFYTNQFTWEMVVKYTSNTGTYQGLVWAEGSTGGGSGLQYLLTLNNLTVFHYRVYNSLTGWAATDTANITFDPYQYNHIVWQFNNGTVYIYVNGTLFHTDTSRGYYSGGTDSAMFLGARNDGSYSSAMLPAMYKHYNRVLSSIEIQQNYNELKKRFNLT
jgi:hypothetical protein